MKKTILTLLVSIFVFSSYAQTDQGSWIIGGNAGFHFDKQKIKVGKTSTDRLKTSSLYISPNVGYFIITNLALGAKLNLSSKTDRTIDALLLSNGRRIDMKENEFILSLGPWGRYYFPVGTKSAFFGEVNTTFGTHKENSNAVNGGREITLKDPSSIVQLGFGPGYTYFISPNIGIEGLLQYRIDRISKKNKVNDQKVAQTTSGLYFNIGLQFYLK